MWTLFTLSVTFQCGFRERNLKTFWDYFSCIDITPPEFRLHCNSRKCYHLLKWSFHKYIYNVRTVYMQTCRIRTTEWFRYLPLKTLDTFSNGCEIIMEEKTPLSHKVVCFQMLHFETSKSNSEVTNLNSNIKKKKLHVHMNNVRYFRGSRFSQCFNQQLCIDR